MPIGSIIAVLLTFSFLLVWVRGESKGRIAALAVVLIAGLSSYPAIRSLYGHPFDRKLYAGPVFGEIAIRIDALSGWFILLTNFTVLTGILYGIRYMQAYKDRTAEISLHYISYIWNQAAMIAVFCVQHALAFLCVWEIMTITAFLLVIFEHGRIDVLKAGINYLVQAHISILFLTLAFIWISSRTGSYDFRAIFTYSSRVKTAPNLLLFLLFFIGFGIKAGFVPFHTWLPYAHPVAPAHISGVMSGVLIKLGIFGILRMLLLIQVNWSIAAYVILTFSVISGIYGVLLAIVQHNVKKLLAYHSIENIGIIGIGIGLGCLGLAWHDPYLSFAGFSGALLHTLNHSLFKSLLFYTTGTVHKYTHTMDIERMGGLIKKLPHTAALFLIGSLAICGLAPFNGFVSEFLLYSGSFRGIVSGLLPMVVASVSVVFSLAVIGGLAMLCFTKAFGIVFLGMARHPYPAELSKERAIFLLPQYGIALLIVAIGLFPQPIIGLLRPAAALFAGPLNDSGMSFPDTIQHVSFAAIAFVAICAAIFLIRKKATASRPTNVSSTWGCGYIAPTAHLQYTANSFVRSSRKLVRPLLSMNKREGEIREIFPRPVVSVTHPYDKLEALLIDRPLRALRGLLGRFKFLQNGSEQFYILYGVSFILIAIVLPILADAVMYILNLFNAL